VVVPKRWTECPLFLVGNIILVLVLNSRVMLIFVVCSIILHYNRVGERASSLYQRFISESTP